MSVTPTPARLLIAGGGIAGLALALASRNGKPILVERRVEFSEAGAGIQISPNGVHALEALGVREALEQVAGAPVEIRVHRGATGEILQRLPLGDWIAHRHGAPYLVAHRRDVQRVLLDALRGKTFSDSPTNAPHISNGRDVSKIIVPDKSRYPAGWNGRVVIEASQNLTIDHEPEFRCGSIDGAALVGADGIHSVVRQHLYPGYAPSFAGRIAARNVIPANLTGLSNEVTGVWLAPGTHVVHYPVRRGAEIAVVVITTEKVWPGAGWSAPASTGQMRRALAPFAPALRDALAMASDWRCWPLFEAPRLPRFAKGLIALIGDAAHPILPFLAQGGSLALEDAVTLAAAIDTFHGDRARAFVHWEKARRKRTHGIANAARRNGWIYHLDGLAARGRDAALRHMSPERIMAGYDWIYGWRPEA